MSVVDIAAERERIRKEIEELEHSLDPEDASIEVIVSGSDLDTDSDSVDISENDDDDSDASLLTEEEKEDGKSDDGVEDKIPACPETCLQINLVYQEVIQEKIEEVALLLTQNKERQEELLWRLSGPRIPKPKKDDVVKPRLFIGSFMKPYFKDKATGCGPPANQDTREKASQGIKSFEELQLSKWKLAEKQLLKDAVMSDSLQHLLQPKLFKHEYLNQKLEKAKDEVSHQILEKQIRETEREIADINQLSEARLLGERTDEHDWDKIANIHFEGNRNADELRKYWQNSEHPSINKEDWSEEEAKTLLEVAASHNYLNWQEIADELGTKRTAFQCLQKYQTYNKDFRRKEWTKAEDQMLTHLVEQMRVGNHIPYQKIAYYMEGRNTFQLIYRWTKSVDPNLKKGPWSKEEDAKLLKAISRYGERDWYKIRDEVPHRSDAQCRDRYHNSLNAKFKKGRWTHNEKAKLMALVDKYGPGHWSKIASELPNRTDSQCLSRWKMSMGLRFYQRKSGKKREIFTESPEETEEEEEDEEEEEFSLESSEESMDEMELQLDDSSEDEMVPHKITRRTKYSKPPIDLWVPTREHIGALRNKLFAETLSNMRRPLRTSKKYVTKSVPPATQNDDSMRHPSGNVGKEVVHRPSNLNTILKGFACSHVTHISTEDPTELLKEAFNAGKYILKVEAEDVKGILKRNTFFLRKKLAEKRARRLNKISDMYQISPGMSLDQVRDVLQAAKKQTMPGFHKTRSLRTGELDRKLYMAVSPWVGNVIVIYSLAPGNVLKRGTQADAIKEELQKVHLATTPVFKFLLQLFRIDADGCLQVIRAATAPPTAPQPDPLVISPGKSNSLVQPPASRQNSTGPSLEYIPPKSSPLLLGSQPVTDNAAPAIQTPKGDVAVAGKRTPSTASFRRPRAPKDKPKTVLELLREKRMKACQSSSSELGLKDAATGEPTGVTPQPLSGQKAQQGSIKPQTPSSSPNQSSLLHSQKDPLAVPLTVIPLDSSTGTSKSAACSPSSQGTGADALKQDNQSVSCGGTPVSHSDSSSEPAASSQAQKGESLASSSLPDKADVPRQVPTTSSVEKDISHTVAKGMPAKAATKPPIATVGSTAPIYIRPPLLNLLPTVLPTQGGPQNVIRNIMPYTFVLTPQTLVSVPLQTLLGLSGANQQATLSTTGLYAPSSNPVSLVGSSNSNVSPSSILPVADIANSNVISHTDAASSLLVETSSKSPGEGQVAVKSSSAVMSSTSMNTGTLASTTTPVLTTSSSSPNMSTTLSSKEILTASPGESRGSNPGAVPSPNPGSVTSSADISTVVPSAELLCSLSLISLSKGGASEPDEPSSFQKEAAAPLEKRPSQHKVPETVVRASTRLLTIGTKRMSTTAKPALRKSIIVPSRPLVCIAPRLPGTPTLTITDGNKIRKPVSIAAKNPTMPTLYSANKNLNLQQPSIAVSTLATPPLSTTVTNQTLSSASIVMRAMTLPHLPCTAKTQYPSFTSIAVKTLGMPPPSNASTNQNPSPVSVATTTLAIPPPSSTATSPNLLPASMSVLPKPPVTSSDTIQNLPPASVSVLPKPPVTSADTIQNLPPASMSVLPKPPVTSANTIQNLPPASMSVLPKPPVTSANTIQNLPPAAMSVLPTPPVTSANTIQNLPPASMSVLPKPPVTSANTIQNLPPASMSVLPKPPVTSANTIQNLPPASMSVLPKPPVTSAGTIQNLPPASVALGSLSMPPPSSTGTNQNLSVASIALRSPSMPRLTSIVNHQNQSPVSVAVRNLTMPPLSSTANKQHRPPVFIPVRNPKTPTSTYGNQKPIASPEKKKVDFSLVSLEEEAKVKGWFRGERGVQVPPLRNGFPYLPPSVCNLKTLSKLLQKKKALEKNVASLLPSKGDNDEQMTEEQLRAVQDMVGQRLKDNPAYLLLKARFLSAFTLPAFLATLAPPKVHTTVRASRHMYGDSDEEEEEENTVRDYDEMDTTDDELKESEHREDNPENQLSEMPLDSSTETFEVTQVAAPFNQEHPVEETLSQETLNNSPTVIEDDTPAPIRRSARLRKKVKK